MSQQTDGTVLKLPNISPSGGRVITYIEEVCVYVAMLFSKAKLDPEAVSGTVFDVRSEWKSHFKQGVQIGTADEATNRFEAVAVIPGKPYTRLNLVYAPKAGETWGAKNLRDHLIRAVGSQRFLLDKADIKEYYRASRPKQPEEGNGVATVSSEVRRRVTVDFKSIGEVNFTALRRSLDANHGESSGIQIDSINSNSVTDGPPENEEVDDGTVSLKDRTRLMNILLEFAIDEATMKGNLFDYFALKRVSEKALKRTISDGEHRGITRALIAAKYINRLGVQPSRYEITDLLIDHANNGIPQDVPVPEKPKAPVTTEPLVKHRTQTADPRQQRIDALRLEVQQKSEAKTQLDALKVQEQGILEALAHKDNYVREIAEISRHIGELQAKLADYNRQLEAKQTFQRVVQESEVALPRIKAEIETLQQQCAGLDEARAKLTKVEDALRLLNEQLGV